MPEREDFAELGTPIRLIPSPVRSQFVDDHELRMFLAGLDETRVGVSCEWREIRADLR
jgi:hypothetical protein